MANLTLAACSRQDAASNENRSSTSATPTPAENSGDSEPDPEDETNTAPGTDELAGGESDPSGDRPSTIAESDPQTGAETMPGKSLVICLPDRRPSFYLYGEDSLVATAVRHALYEDLFISPGYAYSAQGLEKLPSLADGDARREIVPVGEGARVVNADGQVVNLRKGVSVVNAAGETVPFEGEAIEMAQLVVDFTMQPMFWSDGTPVTAKDSVFSFQIAANPFSLANKGKFAFTERYEETGERSMRWTGVPGFVDQTYFTNVWQPLPSHLLGDYTAQELSQLDGSQEMMVGNGPFTVSGADEGDSVTLRANPYYYRQGEGLPHLAEITLRFGELEALLADDTCQVVAGEALGMHSLADLEDAGYLTGWDLVTTPGNVVEQIAFSVVPVSDYAERRPDWFGSAAVRQALAQCIDRQAMVDELTGGRGRTLDTLVPADHPLAPASLTSWTYDPDIANSMLDEAGYRDYAGDGRRQDVSSGVPMTITLGTNSESDVRLRLTEMVAEDLAGCGIPVNRYDLPAGTWFNPGPLGPLFGRQFDLGQAAWLGRVQPACERFMSDEIPGPEEFGFGGWSAANVSGWSNEEFDSACAAALDALPGGDGYEENMREVLRIFNEELPALPLFTDYKVAAVRPGVLNVMPDATEASSMWNVAEWDVRE